MLMHTSYSSLNTYEICPLKYKFQEIDKIKKPKRADQVFGTVVHGALKFMFERTPLYPSLDEVIDFYTKKWNDASEKIVWRREDTKDAEQKMYIDEGRTILKNFYTRNSPWNFNVVDMEARFSLPVVDEEGFEHTIAGIIDRIDKNPNGDEYEIIDYKTARKMPSQGMADNNLQLDIYSLALINKWPKVKSEHITTSLYFLKHNEKISSTHSDEKLERAKRRILAIITEIEKQMKKNDFPPRPGPLCGYCEFRSLCPMWAHEYKTEESKNDPNEQEIAQTIDEFFVMKEEDGERKKRFIELRDVILSYMESHNVDRVFSDTGYITKTAVERISFDMEAVRPFLEKAGVWNDILVPDAKKIDSAIASLPKEIREKIFSIRVKKTAIMLKQKKK